jgi:hypothetical protein
MIEFVLLKTGENFTPELFNIFTKIQEFLWSCAELSLIYFCLKIADIARIIRGKRKIVARRILFWCLVIANPFLLCFAPPATHDKLMFLNFSVLIYTAISERRDLMSLFFESEEGKQSN